MRKLLILLMLAPLALKAQVGEYRTDFAVGVNGGYMMNKISFQPDVPQNMMGGLTGGLSLRYTCEKYFKSICAIVAEVNYAQMGWKENIEDNNNEPVYYVDDTEKQNPLFYERRINYIQIPVMARMGWGRERRGLQFFAQAGPQVGFFLNEKTVANFDTTKPNLADRTSKIVAQDSMSVERPIEYGIAGGVGLEFSINKVGHFLLEGRYYYGLGDVFGNSKRDYFGRSNLSNIVIKMTYLFDIRRSKNSKIK